MLNKFVDLFGWVILGSLGSVEQIRGSIRMRCFGLFGLSTTNLRNYSEALFLVVWVVLNKFVDLFKCAILRCFGCLGCVEQIHGSIWMGYFRLFRFS